MFLLSRPTFQSTASLSPRKVSGRQESSSSRVAVSTTNCSMGDCAPSDRQCRAWTLASVMPKYFEIEREQ